MYQFYTLASYKTHQLISIDHVSSFSCHRSGHAIGSGIGEEAANPFHTLTMGFPWLLIKGDQIICLILQKSFWKWLLLEIFSVLTSVMSVCIQPCLTAMIETTKVYIVKFKGEFLIWLQWILLIISLLWFSEHAHVYPFDIFQHLSTKWSKRSCHDLDEYIIISYYCKYFCFSKNSNITDKCFFFA